MVMYRQISSDPLEPEDLWDDLRTNLNMLDQLGISDVMVFFGVGWGSQIYEGNWAEFSVPTLQVEERIKEAESKGYGKLGSDNFYMSIPEYEARVEYTLECDIAISAGNDNIFVSTLLRRWEKQEWLLVHHSKKKNKKR